MPPWSFHSATSLVFGSGAIEQLQDVVERGRYRKILIITDATLKRIGLVDRALAPLARAGCDVQVFAGCVPEPPLEVIQRAAAEARVFGPDLLIGLGGGSNMDTAKLVAVVLAHGGQPTDWVGDCRVPGPVFPLVCIPTTSGTGSEVSAAAVFTDTQKQIKVSTLSQYLRPLAAIVDPVLTYDCPKQVTADSGIDALTHAIEALTAADHAEFLQRPPGGATVYQGRNPLADMVAGECIMLVGQYLERAVINGHDHEARDKMAYAATLGGLAFSNAGVALVHAMEYPVGGAVHVSHGAGNGLLLPYVMRYNAEVRADEIQTIGMWLAGPSGALSAFQAGVDGAIEVVEKLREKIGIPTRLREIGVTQAMLPGFAEKAFAIKRLMRTNPRMPQSADEILEIYRAAW
jgi:alcohol dehydrogenase class IV